MQFRHHRHSQARGETTQSCSFRHAYWCERCVLYGRRESHRQYGHYVHVKCYEVIPYYGALLHIIANPITCACASCCEPENMCSINIIGIISVADYLIRHEAIIQQTKQMCLSRLVASKSFTYTPYLPISMCMHRGLAPWMCATTGMNTGAGSAVQFLLIPVIQ